MGTIDSRLYMTCFMCHAKRNNIFWNNMKMNKWQQMPFWLNCIFKKAFSFFPCFSSSERREVIFIEGYHPLLFSSFPKRKNLPFVMLCSFTSQLVHPVTLLDSTMNQTDSGSGRDVWWQRKKDLGWSIASCERVGFCVFRGDLVSVTVQFRFWMRKWWRNSRWGHIKTKRQLTEQANQFTLYETAETRKRERRQVIFRRANVESWIDAWMEMIDGQRKRERERDYYHFCNVSGSPGYVYVLSSIMLVCTDLLTGRVLSTGRKREFKVLHFRRLHTTNKLIQQRVFRIVQNKNIRSLGDAPSFHLICRGGHWR